jgi:hypothetical protein
MMAWSEQSVSECPGCGATVAVGIMSLAAVCRIDGYYYVDIEAWRGWYSSRIPAETAVPQTEEGGSTPTPTLQHRSDAAAI